MFESAKREKQEKRKKKKRRVRRSFRLLSQLEWSPVVEQACGPPGRIIWRAWEREDLSPRAVDFPSGVVRLLAVGGSSSDSFTAVRPWLIA